ncbi:MAG TPA: acetyl-CoA hydrolase, partial [Bradyrhizobium sp.]|nr:acetyl-CoA hydrolase [Bradyrhizobium sp.]
DRIAAALKPAREAGLLPQFPFGSDFTDTEQRLIPALQLLQDAQRAPHRLPAMLWQGLTRTVDAADSEGLARLGLDVPKNLSERAYRALVSAALARSRAG